MLTDINPVRNITKISFVFFLDNNKENEITQKIKGNMKNNNPLKSNLSRNNEWNKIISGSTERVKAIKRSAG
tara:strand:- start:77 stop:292 length:216 start_codon:yes stop_codon:yes gene_type:complete